MNELLSNGLFWYSVLSTLLLSILILERRGAVPQDVVNKAFESVPREYVDGVVETLKQTLLTNERKWDDVFAHLIDAAQTTVWYESKDDDDLADEDKA